MTEPENEVVERVARAIYEQEPWGDGTTWQSMPESGELEFRRKARAAIAAMPSPWRGEPVAWRWRTLPQFSEVDDDGKWQLAETAPTFINPHHHVVEPLFAPPET